MNIDKGLDVQDCEMDIYKNYRGRWSKLSNFTVVIRVKNEERWMDMLFNVLDHLTKPEIVIKITTQLIKLLIEIFCENQLNNEANNYSKIKIVKLLIIVLEEH